ncbi:MAG: tetratricopeptide repeat protein [Candidatus Obscuribacterales bacterium]|nr:tetratricopeptide repeat protein [Candidatus Obscuribacterales bacterium]
MPYKLNATGNSSTRRNENRGGCIATAKRLPCALLGIYIAAVVGLCACTADLDDSNYRVGVWEQLWMDATDAQKENRLIDARRLLDSAAKEIEQSKRWLRIGVTYDRLGDVYLASNMGREAESAYQRALSAFNTYKDTNKSVANERLVIKEIVGTSKSLSPLLIEGKHFKDAEKLITDAIQSAERIGGPEMQNSTDRLLIIDYAENIRCLGQLYERTNRYTEAERCYLKAARFLPALLVKDRDSRLLHNIVTLEHDRSTGKTLEQTQELNNLVRSWSPVYESGFEAIENQDLATARDRFREAYEMIKDADPYGHHTMDSLSQLIKVTNKLNQFQQSEKLVAESFPGMLKAVPSKRIDNVLGEMAETCRRTKNWTMSEEILKHRIEVRKAIHGQDNIHVAEALNNLGDFYSSTERRTEAEDFYQKALKVLSEANLIDTDLASVVKRNIDALK